MCASFLWCCCIYAHLHPMCQIAIFIWCRSMPVYTPYLHTSPASVRMHIWIIYDVSVPMQCSPWSCYYYIHSAVSNTVVYSCAIEHKFLRIISKLFHCESVNIATKLFVLAFRVARLGLLNATILTALVLFSRSSRRCAGALVCSKDAALVKESYFETNNTNSQG